MSSEVHSKDPNWERIVYLFVSLEETFEERILETNRTKIVLFLSGTIRMTNRCGMKEEIGAPALIFVNDQDGLTFEKVGEVKAEALYFHPCALNDMLDYEQLLEQQLEKATTLNQDAILLYPVLRIGEYIDSDRYMLLTKQNMIYIDKLLKRLHDELEEQRDGYWPCRSRSYFIELLLFIHSLCEEEQGMINENQAEKISLYNDITDYMKKNYSEVITVGDLTKRFGVNRNILNRIFQDEVSMSPIQYLVDYRIHAASLLLRKTELPIAEIANRTGFGSATYFGRMFKRHMGCAPQRYRKEA